MLKVAVITVSDRAAAGVYQDLSGPAVVAELEASGLELEISTVLVADEENELRRVLDVHLDKDFIITTGGTGLAPRDITPEVTASFCDREVPGISEWLRLESLAETKNAVLSRGYSGQKGKTIIVNFPGSRRGAAHHARLLAGIMRHAAAMVDGADHQHR